MAFAGIPKLALCGGEPFLFEGIFEVIRYAGQKGIYCAVTTNGMTLSRMKGEELELLRRHRVQVHLSMDSFDEGIQCLTRGHPKALALPLAAIRLLRAHGIPVTLLAAISRYNAGSLPDLVKTACEEGVGAVIFQPLIWSSNYPDRPPLESKASLNVEPDHIPALLSELRAVRAYEKDHPVRTNAYRILPWIRKYLETAAGLNGRWFFSELVPRFYCREVHAVIDISYDGGIQPCGLAPATATIFGDRAQGLMALWEDASRALREDMDAGNYPDFCNSCCHKFSRNMMASALKHPISNRALLGRMALAMISRGFHMTRHTKASLQP
jgi:MoaA/NifB/PqqE/SkfB family radical SAM enzyme